MAIKRACVTCGKPSTGNYCDAHKRTAWSTSKRASKVKLSGSQQQARRKRILAELLYTCHVCGKVRDEADLELDHVTPLSEGGADTDYNCAPICADPCHREKTAAEAKRARDRMMVSRRYGR